MYTPMSEYELESMLEPELQFEEELEAEFEDEAFLEGEAEFEDFLEGEVDAALAAAKPRQGGTIVVPPITITVRPAFKLTQFAFNRSDIKPHHYPTIKKAAQMIVNSWRTARPIISVRLVGHTDNHGRSGYNEGLGQRRALAVEKALRLAIEKLRPGLTHRIRFVPQSSGERRPIAKNNTEAARAQNRRVEIYFVRKI
jgi:outer membrane protein OmpA-like peptidoglycan-associated protein